MSLGGYPFRPYKGNDVTKDYTYLPKWGWCKATKHHDPEIVSMIGRWTVSRLGWGQDTLTWDQLTSQEKETLMRGYKKA